MDKIHSLHEVQEIIQQIRLKRQGFITNFFLDPFKHTLWLDKGEFYADSFSGCTLLVKKNELFSSLFYIAVDESSLEMALQQHCEFSQGTYIVDVVGSESVVTAKNVFISSGFQEYECLYRMSRLGLPDISFPLDGNVTDATLDDAVAIKELLNIYFDPLSEQIPTVEEIERFIKENGVLVYKADSTIGGFIISELLGATLYLRYWFVAPEFRNKHVGSKLFNSFMNKGAATKRQLFWVIASNENAIKRYLHYGFVPEKLYDYVLIKRK